MQQQPQQPVQQAQVQSVTRFEIPGLKTATTAAASAFLAKTAVQHEELKVKENEVNKLNQLHTKIADQQFEIEQQKLLTPEERTVRWQVQQARANQLQQQTLKNQLGDDVMYWSSCRCSPITPRSWADHSELALTRLVGENWSNQLPSLFNLFAQHRQVCGTPEQFNQVRNFLTGIYTHKP